MLLYEKFKSRDAEARGPGAAHGRHVPGRADAHIRHWRDNGDGSDGRAHHACACDCGALRHDGYTPGLLRSPKSEEMDTVT